MNIRPNFLQINTAPSDPITIRNNKLITRGQVIRLEFEISNSSFNLKSLIHLFSGKFHEIYLVRDFKNRVY